MILLQIERENFFFRPVNTDKPNFVSSLVFVGAAASFTAKIFRGEIVLGIAKCGLFSQTII